MKTISFLFVFVFALFNSSCSQPKLNRDMKKAADYFEKLKQISDLDNAELWGKAIFGPTMFVDAKTREIVANQQNKDNTFEKKGDLYYGVFPEEMNVANTSVTFCGEKWTCVQWNNLRDMTSTTHLLLHESWHRIQDEIGLPGVTSMNHHLDEMDGEILLKLELIILNSILQNENCDSDEGLRNAMIVRRKRQTLYPKGNEDRFECHEGMAEYTAYKLLSNSDNDNGKNQMKRISSAISKGLNGDGFGNSFAYLTGPAYGFILDDMYPNWRNEIKSGKTVQDIVSSFINIPEVVENEDIERITKQYDTDMFLNKERTRLETQAKADSDLRNRFANSQWLIIPNDGVMFSFDPNERLVAYDSIGVIYNTMRLSGNFGIIEAENGVMRTNNWSSFIIPYSQESDNAKISLNPEYLIIKVDEKIYTIVKQ